MIKCLTALCACFCFSQTVLAWNAEGHMVVTQIAYNHLDASVRARCDALIPKSTRKKNRHGSALNFGAKWSSRNTCEQARNWLEARRECRREFFRVYRALGSNLESNTTKPGNRP
jgi:hypothetical protein